MISALRAIEDACAWVGRMAGWLVVPLMLAVCVAVAAVQLRVNVVASWSTPLPVLGTELSVNGLLDLQWHLFAVLVLLGGVYAYRSDAHVSVDVFSQALPARLRTLVTVFGDLVLLVPFALLMVWFSWNFVGSAYRSGEGSSYGGLLDRWIIKSVMPLGFGLLALAGTARGLRKAVELATGREPEGAHGRE
ncbi:TRAP transporter small permease subunit [Azospirillum sp. ST 5-10]|uniref:TRAP transporter small permease subunit n=1 Tax=unclassified Azospirillum TaxID=2630922 RepID=UPI003F49FEB9